MFRLLCSTFIFLACVSAADAASCRAGAAAEIGSQAGYNKAKEAAEAWAKRQNTISASLGDCLGTISTTITAPTFPNLSDVLNQIGQKVCEAARDKINDYVPSTIDPWGDLTNQLTNQLSNQLSSYSSYAPKIQSQPIQLPQQVMPAASAPASSSSDNPSSFISLN